MKHKLLHFKSILCSLGILLLLIGCQNDEGKHAHNENLKVQKVSLAEIPAIKDVLELKSRTVAARSNGETNYFAYANPENVYVYTDDEGLNTYTFSLSLAEPENQMSNLVIREIPDGTFQYRLMRYESDEMATWKQDIASGIKPTATVRISSEILEAPLQRGGGACDTFVTDFTCPSGMHNGWSRSECVHEFYTWSTKVTVMSLDCGREEGGGGAGPSSGGVFISVPNAPVNILANFVSGLSIAQKSWWNNTQNAVAVSIIKDYLNANAYMASSIAFSKEMINSALNNTAVSFSPFFKYPVGSNYSTLYPELTYIAKEFVPTLKTDNQLIETIRNLTGMPSTQIIKNLTWGYGAEINVTQLGNDEHNRPYKGKFNPSQPDKIFIDIDLVQQLENMPENGTRGLIRRFITYSVLIHELVHYADYDVDQIMSTQELGDIFEEIFGQGWVLEFILDQNGNETGEIGWIKVN